MRLGLEMVLTDQDEAREEDRLQRHHEREKGERIRVHGAARSDVGDNPASKPRDVNQQEGGAARKVRNPVTEPVERASLGPGFGFEGGNCLHVANDLGWSCLRLLARSVLVWRLRRCGVASMYVP